MQARHYWVSGRVQGVFYRASCQQQAKKTGLTGWVKNLYDGRVELLACGSADQLASLEAWLHQGPPMSVVEAVEIKQETEVPEISSFEVRY